MQCDNFQFLKGVKVKDLVMNSPRGGEQVVLPFQHLKFPFNNDRQREIQSHKEEMIFVKNHPQTQIHTNSNKKYTKLPYRCQY